MRRNNVEGSSTSCCGVRAAGEEGWPKYTRPATKAIQRAVSNTSFPAHLICSRCLKECPRTSRRSLVRPKPVHQSRRGAPPQRCYALLSKRHSRPAGTTRDHSLIVSTKQRTTV